MFFKLAVRNVKRQFTNYLIYFMTVAFTVALLFAVNNVLYSDALLLLLNGESDLRTILTWLVALVGLVVAFVLSYATSFMLKLRRREFGTYLTLGMQRGDILRIFLFETLLICGAALGAGLVLGLFLYQGLLALVMRMTEAAYAFSGYSLQGLRITVAVVAGIFVTALLVSSGYLRKVSIHDLLHGEKKVEKAVRHPVCWACVMLAAVTVVVGCLVSMSGQIEALIRESRGSAGSLITVMGMFALALMLFHVALTKSVVFLLLRCRQFRIRGSRTFVLRQLSGSLSSNALMHGSLAFLLTFAVIWVNLSFIIKGGQAEMLERSYPYDATYCEDRFFEGREQENAIPLAECERRIEKYRAILKKIPYQLYTTGRRELYEHTCWSKDVGYAGLVDFFMPAGDFNALIEPLGYEKVTLVDEYLIVSIDGRVGMTDFSSVTFAEAGKTYRFRGYTEEYPTFCRTYFFAVVPDANLQSKGIIYLIESKIRPSNSAVALLGFNQYSLEHLMPKKWRNNWPPCATDDLERRRDSILLTLGNLAIITQSLNASIRDAAWDMKKAGNGNGKPGLALCASGLCTLHDVLMKADWDESEISARAKWLFEQARTIWSL